MEPIAVRAIDLADFTHVVASREGLYVINQSRYEKLAEGSFYGLTVRRRDLYCFEAVGDDRLANSGRIVKLAVERSRIVGAAIVATDLPNGTHQIDFIGSRLFACDTYNNRLLVFDEGFRAREVRYPVGRATPLAWDSGYVHLNSVVGTTDGIFLMKHNGTAKGGRASEVMQLDHDLRPVETHVLPGGDCHNIVFLESGEPIFCDSMHGNLIDRRGVLVHLDEMFTRGLSVDGRQIVVGSSYFTTRKDRRFVPGRVYFLTRTYEVVSVLDLPGAPTEVRRIDGEDLSISDHRVTLPPIARVGLTAAPGQP